MASRTTLLIPAADETRWEVWSVNGAPAASLKDVIDVPADLRILGSPVIGLPNRHCRTFSLRLPSEDRVVLQKMVHAHLEKKGLTELSLRDALFDVRIVASGNAESTVTVDALCDALPGDWEIASARAYTPALRLFHLPRRAAVLVREHRQLILAVGTGGQLLHSQALGSSRVVTPAAAREIGVALLALDNDGIAGDIEALEAWGDFTDDDLAVLEKHLHLPVDRRDRPAPMPRPPGDSLHPIILPAVRKAHRRKRLAMLCSLLAIMLIAGYVFLLFQKNNYRKKLETRVVQLEEEAQVSREIAESVKSQTSRWNTMRNVIDPKRYPVLHLNHIARVMPEGGVKIARFESKVTEIQLDGTAKDAAAAFHFAKALNEDPALSVYSWNIGQPSVESDGSVSFTVKAALK